MVPPLITKKQVNNGHYIAEEAWLQGNRKPHKYSRSPHNFNRAWVADKQLDYRVYRGMRLLIVSKSSAPNQILTVSRCRNQNRTKPTQLRPNARLDAVFLIHFVSGLMALLGFLFALTGQKLLLQATAKISQLPSPLTQGAGYLSIQSLFGSFRKQGDPNVAPQIVGSSL